MINCNENLWKKQIIYKLFIDFFESALFQIIIAPFVLQEDDGFLFPENRDIFLQWGYIFSDGTFVSIVIVAKFSFSSSYTYDQLLIYAPKGIPVRGFITGIP